MYTIIYRIGGTLNFEWKRVNTTYDNYDTARYEASRLERMGFPTHIHKTKDLNIIGLPETYK